MSADIKNILVEARNFIKELSDNISSNEMNESAKQVFFLDNQVKIKETMESLNNVKSMYDDIGAELEGEDQKQYEICVGLMNKLTKTLSDFKNANTNANPNVTTEDTTVVVNESTINEAAQNNSSTKQMIKDMNEINEKASIAQLQEFTHAILVGKKFTYAKPTTIQELNNWINELADANPNEKISVYEVSFNPMPLKQRTVYTV